MNKSIIGIGVGVLLCGVAIRMVATEPEWSAASIKERDRACLVGVMDGYMDALFKHDPKAVPPLALDVRMTENTGVMDVGEGVLWRIRWSQPTSRFMSPIRSKARWPSRRA